jgi:hypothetical protein
MGHVGVPIADRPDRFPTGSRFANLADIGFGQLRLRLPFASPNKTGRRRVGRIASVSDVLKIAGAIVLFVTVDVVDLVAGRPRPNERLRDELMDVNVL